MTTTVEKSILVNVPVSTAYNQWTQFEDFPQFMNGITSVTQLSDNRLEWVAEIAGVKRQWEAQILEQIPDQKVAWAAIAGATNAGEVRFEDVGGGQTSVHLFLEYEPQGLVEKVGDKFNIVENEAEGDLDRFKAFIEAEGYASGAWRGTVNAAGHVGTPGVAHADASRGDDGKAGLSGKAVAAGVGLAAAGVAAVIASKSGSDDDDKATTVSAPATTTPATSTPATSTPATSTPATTTPATSTPATSTPATSTPATSTPATTTPAAGTSVPVDATQSTVIDPVSSDRNPADRGRDAV